MTRAFSRWSAAGTPLPRSKTSTTTAAMTSALGCGSLMSVYYPDNQTVRAEVLLFHAVETVRISLEERLLDILRAGDGGDSR